MTPGPAGRHGMRVPDRGPPLLIKWATTLSTKDRRAMGRAYKSVRTPLLGGRAREGPLPAVARGIAPNTAAGVQATQA